MPGEIENWITSHEDLLDKCINLAAVFIGGIITYIVTVRASRNEARREMMLNNRDNILIPLCTAVEDILSYMLHTWNILSFKSNDLLLQKSNTLLEFLNANKRIFLDKYTRSMLTNYNELINSFEKKLENNAENAISFLQRKTSDILDNFGGIERTIDIAVHTSNSSLEKIKECILLEKDIDALYLITSVTFIFDNDSDNFRYLSVDFDEEFYEYIWHPVQSGHIDLNDLNVNSEQELAFHVENYLDENFSDVRKTFNILIKQFSINDDYRNIIEELQSLHTNILNHIDVITDN